MNDQKNVRVNNLSIYLQWAIHNRLASTLLVCKRVIFYISIMYLRIAWLVVKNEKHHKNVLSSPDFNESRNLRLTGVISAFH